MTIEANPGFYQHYKGGTYTVLFVAEESTNGRAGLTVVYVSHTNGRIFARELSEFTEPVPWPDGSMRQRFELQPTPARGGR